MNAASVTVNLPPGARVLEAAVTYSAVPVDWVTSPDGSTLTFTPDEPIPPYQEVEIGVVFSHGAIAATPPSWQAAEDRRVEWENKYEPLLDLLFGALGILLLIGAPVGVLLLWYSFGRDPEVGPVPEYLSEPPSDLRPGVAGTLLDESADMQDILATLVDLGRRSIIEIEEQSQPAAFGTTYREFVFRRKGEGDLKPFEKSLLDAVFGSKTDEVRLSALRRRFSTHLARLETELYREALQAGFFRFNPETVRDRYRGAGIALMVISMFVGIFAVAGLADYVGTIICPFVGLGAAGLGLAIAAGRMPAKTRRGAEEAAKWTAFKRYLQTIERQTDLKQAAQLFDHYLPYAVAFGLERSWVAKFSQVNAVPVPGWYRPYPRPIVVGGMPGTAAAGRPGGGVPSLQGASEGLAGGLQSMSQGLVTMLNTAGHVFAAPPPGASGTSGHYGGVRGGGYRGGSFRVGGGGGGGRRGFG